MIRMAFLAVLAGAGLLAYLGFAVVRGTGGDAVPAASEVTTPVPEAAETEQPAEADRVYFLRDALSPAAEVALVLHRAAADGTDLVVTDKAALEAARETAFVVPDGSDEGGANGLVISGTDSASENALVSLYLDDQLVVQVSCAAPCAAAPAGRLDLAGLDQQAEPLVAVRDQFADYTAYLDALSAIAADPDFALLDQRTAVEGGHPVAQVLPTASLALPTIIRLADQPLDVDTHTALLSAVVQDAMPDGARVDAVTITDLGAPVVVDMDNGRPATAGGQPIVFADLRFYAPYVALSGTADLPVDTLEALTSQTQSRLDYAAEAEAFIAGLGVPCPDCFDIQVRGDVYTEATVIHGQPERYDLTYYDLREAP